MKSYLNGQKKVAQATQKKADKEEILLQVAATLKSMATDEKTNENKNDDALKRQFLSFLNKYDASNRLRGAYYRNSKAKEALLEHYRIQKDETDEQSLYHSLCDIVGFICNE